MSTIQLSVDLYALIDEAGALDSEIKRLTAQLETIKATIKAQGAGDYAGFDFTAKVTEATRESIDYKAICAKLEPSRQLIAAHTSRTTIQSIKFSKV